MLQIATKDEGNLSKLSALLCNDASKSVGLIISERIMNIPPQLSVPLYESLFNEISKARARDNDIQCCLDMIMLVGLWDEDLLLEISSKSVTKWQVS